MRYDDWDVILFPKDSHVPIQEFKTACFVSQADYGRPLPTLTCFISSLPPSTPFRISLHSWRTVLKASALLESQRKGNQKIVFMVQVIIGDTIVFHGSFDLASKWPQEITHEKRSLVSNNLPSSQRRRPLEFPPFHSFTLMNNIWDARDPYGRIRIVLSEQLINKTPNPGNLEFGTVNELVCFSFQHAPKEVLQQAGISWPIQNPLYLPDTFTRNNQYPQTAMAASSTPHGFSFAENIYMQTPPAQNAQPVFGRPHEAGLKQHPNTHLTPIPPFLKQSVGPTSHGRHKRWDDTFAFLGHATDDIGMDNWATRRRTSAPYDYSTPSYVSTSHSSANCPPWMSNVSQYGSNKSNEWDDHPTVQEEQVVVTLRDDQLGQIIDALSPQKNNREILQTPSAFYQDHCQKAPHNYFSSKSTTAPLMNRPSLAFPARKTSFPDSNTVLRNISNKLSSQNRCQQDENKDTTPSMRQSHTSTRNDVDPSQLRLHTPSPHSNIMSMPNPFSQRQPTAVSDFSIRDWPSAHSGILRLNRNRKETPTSDAPKALDQTTRRDANLSQTANLESRTKPGSVSKARKPSTQHDRRSIPDLVEIIDIDALDPELDAAATGAAKPSSPFKPSHKSDVSLDSTDSTLRLERQLFSALGEELGSFDRHHHHHHSMDTTTDMRPELAHTLGAATTHSELAASAVLEPTTTTDLEPTGKRKRQETASGGSPLSKKEKAELADRQK